MKKALVIGSWSFLWLGAVIVASDRNLGIGDGIELVYVPAASGPK